MTSVHDNPLLDVKHPIAFDRFRADQVVPAIQQLLAEARERLDTIAKAPPSWDRTMGALDTMTERLDDAMGVIGHLESVAMTPELRAAYNEIQPEVSAFYSSIVLSEPLWKAIQAYAATDEAKALTGPKRRFVDKTLADFRRHGADLDDEGKKSVAAIDVELGKLTLTFSQNVLDATGAFELLVDDEERLAGLPEGAKAAARQSADSAGKPGWRFTLQAPSYLAAMTYLDDVELRERLYRAFNSRAARDKHDNRPIVRRILELRQQKARRLGFGDFADLVLADRMARGGDQARSFVATLRERTDAAFEAEKADLQSFRREIEGAEAPTIQPWDVSYYAEKQRRARYDLDEEELRPYFAAERVIEGLFAVAHRLYGVTVEPWKDAPVWHPSVRAFALRDQGGEELARFYVDIYPRDDKRDGAWMHGMIQGYGSRPQGVAVFAANLTPPIGDQPALLTHREVETLFHEFGHLLHHALSKVELRSLAGTNVAWDFVELPSQIMENWCWEREALDLFARHHETGEPLPDVLLDRMLRARSFRAAAMQMRQLGFAETDLTLHAGLDLGEGFDPIAHGRDILARHSPTPLPDDYAMLASFSHLFSSPVGYAAGYYSYKWAEVLDADAFAVFRQGGIFDRTTGERFRREILERGDSDEPGELFRRFRGAEPSIEPLMTRLGLRAPRSM